MADRTPRPPHVSGLPHRTDAFFLLLSYIRHAFAGAALTASDAYISILREYYRRRREDNVLQRISDLEKKVAELKAELKKNV